MFFSDTRYETFFACFLIKVTLLAKVIYAAYYFSLYIPCDAIINEILKSQTMWEMLNIHPIFLHMFYECSTCDQERFF